MTNMMTMVLKRIAGLIGILLLLGVLALAGIITLVDPNQFKGPLQNYVLQETQRNLTIKGPLRWHINPTLSLEALDLHLGNPATFTEDFLNIEKATLKTHFWPLFLGKIVVDLELKGPLLNLERVGNDDNNWQDLFLRWKQKTQGKIFSTHLLLNGLQVEDGKITWRDSLHKESYLITGLSANAQKLFLGPLDAITPLSCHFTVQDTQGSNVGTFAFNAEWQFQPSLNRILLQNINIKTQYQNHPKSVLSGEMTIFNPGALPLIEGKARITEADLALVFAAFGRQPNATYPRNAELTFTFKYQSPWWELPNFMLILEDKGVLSGNIKMDPSSPLSLTRLQGEITGKQLSFDTVKIPYFKTAFQMQGAVLALHPIEFQMAKGRHQGNLQIDFREHKSKFLLHHQGEDFEMNDILSLLGYKDKLIGRSRMKASLTAEGETLTGLLHSLSGNIELGIVDGTWTGMDFVSLLQTTRGSVQEIGEAFAKKESINIVSSISHTLQAWSNQAANSHTLSTPFETTSAHLHFEHGIMHNTDFVMTHPDYRLEGQGTLDFVNNVVQYQISAWSKAPLKLSADWAKLLTETALPINIKGPFSNPVLQPHFEAYAKDILQAAKMQAPKSAVEKPELSEKTDKIDKLIDKGIEKLFGL